MKKDIEIPEVKGVSVAIIPEGEGDAKSWYVYLINENKTEMTNILVSSKGYKNAEDGSTTKTTTLRHMIGTLPANSFAKIESIIEEVFELNNQFWVSFQMEGKMFDKKYVFLSETIQEKYFNNVPLINQKGVLIK